MGGENAAPGHHDLSYFSISHISRTWHSSYAKFQMMTDKVSPPIITENWN